MKKISFLVIFCIKKEKAKAFIDVFYFSIYYYKNF